MTTTRTAPVTFKEHELAGWSAKAGAYDDHFGQVTARIAPAMLGAAGVGSGTRLLDVACGPGYIAAGGAAPGAPATRLDFAPTMAGHGRHPFPRGRFEPGAAD